ncbi:MAG TPA: GNAT family N-acetyltransferase [Phototrophicaceae bacterium]|nr:GNAT family N-acetyltransferase [Phototrophicaceae bacterium]
MNTAARYELLDPADKRWQAYLAAKPDVNIFQHPAWLHLLSECYGYRSFILAVKNYADDICGGLPLVDVRSLLTGARWVSLPVSDYSLPLYDDENVLEYLVDALVDLTQTMKAPKIEIRAPLPEHRAICTYTNFVMHSLKLFPDAKATMAQFHRNHRQNIQTAEKRGVQIERGVSLEQMRAFYRLQVETRHRHGLPVQPWRYFRLLTSLILQHDLGFILLASKDAEYLAGAVFLHWGQTLTAKYAASQQDALQFRPNELIFWTAMQWGSANGFTVFDMGRTECVNEGLREYKRRWGAQEIPLPYSVVAGKNLPSTTGKSMEIMQKVIARAPTWVCRAAGELLYPHFV